ncbi:CheY-like chemotaxis protein [Silvimonas terrae]|uniref:CheY-like chemotaxis protein n=1 Tax=Silvimonas terrae TaxID=300266 RepID=A0A840R7V8_9NEIS|nr:response regulator [Silvimonas terrae]MBB5189365.1 CheY-like chemotaxis protein [Silvimonas terrae]
MNADRLSILYVEDNEMLRATIVEYLEEMSLPVTPVASAEDALERLARQHFDVLLTDVSLPGRSGMDLGRDALTLYPDIHLIISTGHDVSGFVQNMPNTQCLPKPFDLDDIDAVLNNIRQALAERA